jgi:hypothetical protein
VLNLIRFCKSSTGDIFVISKHSYLLIRTCAAK